MLITPPLTDQSDLTRIVVLKPADETKPDVKIKRSAPETNTKPYSIVVVASKDGPYRPSYPQVFSLPNDWPYPEEHFLAPELDPVVKEVFDRFTVRPVPYAFHLSDSDCPIQTAPDIPSLCIPLQPCAPVVDAGASA